MPESLTPGQLRKLKNRAIIYIDPALEETESYQKAGCGILTDKMSVLNLASQGWEIYTGLHRSYDWSRTAWWSRGQHFVNTTGAVAAVRPPYKSIQRQVYERMKGQQ